MLLFCFISIPVYAKDGKLLNANTTYNLQLNSNKKLKVMYKFHDGSSNGKSYWNLYIDGKSVYKFSYKGDDENSVNVFYIDVDKKDKYHELLIICSGLNLSYINANIVRYNSSNKIKRIPFKTNSFKGSFYSTSCRAYPFVEYEGDKVITMMADTPFLNAHFGNYRCKVKAIVKKTQVNIKNESKYKLLDISGALNRTNGYYELKKGMALYKTSSKKKVKKKLSAGTRFSASQIKPDTKAGNYWSLYVKVKTTSGDTGWLYFPGTEQAGETEYLTYKPGWG